MAIGEDRYIRCVDCGEEFLFTAGEQTFYESRGLNAPTRCKQCRDAKRAQREAGGGGDRHGGGGMRGGGGGPRGDREMHEAVCAECGAKTMVPFAPTPTRPVYCKDCWQTRRPDAGSRGGGGHGGGGGGGRGPRGGGGGGGGGGGYGGGGARAHAPVAPVVSSGPRIQGAVKWFNDAKGYGFIDADGGEEVFVHFSSISGAGFRSLTGGDRVEFDVVDSGKGKQAANVVKI